MQRRDFITLLGGAAAAWPLAARGQQPLRLIGVLIEGTIDVWRDDVVDFRRGLAETGYVEGQNVAIEIRASNGQTDKLPALAADLVRHRVMVIVAENAAAVRAAKAATTTIPIVFTSGSDPVKLGFVSSFNRPRGNVTGVTGWGANSGQNAWACFVSSFQTPPGSRRWSPRAVQLRNTRLMICWRPTAPWGLSWTWSKSTTSATSIGSSRRLFNGRHRRLSWDHSHCSKDAANKSSLWRPITRSQRYMALPYSQRLAG